MQTARLAFLRSGLILFAALTLVVAASRQTTARPSSSATDDRVEMTGEYLWTQGGNMREPLDATFERIEDDRWAATLRFPFEGRRHTWKGEFVGDPLSGDFNGEVEWGRGRRPRRWSVEGSTSDGVYRATHTERLRDGGRSRTGSITLRPE